jgi:hypothetical protein
MFGNPIALIGLGIIIGIVGTIFGVWLFLKYIDTIP